MPKQSPTTTVLLDRQLIIYKRERSNVWQCRFQVDGKWQRTSTDQTDKDKAVAAAHEILIKANVRKEMNVSPITRTFRDIAKLAVKRMYDELEAGQGKVSYKDYKLAIDNYLIPALGKYYIDNIDLKALDKLDDYRIKQMGKTPKRSTIVTHNAALNRIFDEAIIRGFMVESNRPKLEAKGKKGERRVEFSLKEIAALKGNFDAWISRGRADSKELRAKQKKLVAKIHEDVANARHHFLHQQSYRLAVKNHATTVMMETLMIKNMVRNRKLARHISDCSWGMFENALEYKLAENGKNLIKINTFLPSTKQCRMCKTKNSQITLKDRVFVCRNCHHTEDRDLHAAINIRDFGYEQHTRSLGTCETVKRSPDAISVGADESAKGSNVIGMGRLEEAPARFAYAN